MNLEELQKEVHQIAKDKGWYSETMPSFGNQVSNMHSELSEAWESWRRGNPPSDHIPKFSGVEEEFADVIIRILDAAEFRGLRVIEAIAAKMDFNKTREYRHGGKRC